MDELASIEWLLNLRLRPDLVAVEVEMATGQIWMVKDPLTLEHHQFTPQEYFLLDCLRKPTRPGQTVPRLRGQVFSGTTFSRSRVEVSSPITPIQHRGQHNSRSGARITRQTASRAKTPMVVRLEADSGDPFSGNRSRSLAHGLPREVSMAVLMARNCTSRHARVVCDDTCLRALPRVLGPPA